MAQFAGRIVGTVAGAAGGFFLGGPAGALQGAAIGYQLGSAVDQSNAPDSYLPDVIGPRLSDLEVQKSAYGDIMPIIYGSVRLGGNIIWAQNIKETEVRETQSSSGGKGGGPSQIQTSVTYAYSATIAIAICEGPIDEVVRIRADAAILTLEDLQDSAGKIEIHLGAEDQAVSTILESYDGVGNVPNYRGVAYVVLEDFPLAAFGNRIPNFNFEVRRDVRFDDGLEDKITDVVLIPGSGEFVYSPTITDKAAVVDSGGGDYYQSGKKIKMNMHNYDDVANVTLALDQMEKALPNLEYVAVIVNWFITTSVVANAEVIPKVEFNNTQAQVTPTEWSVAGLTRATAQKVLTFPDGSATYGGTPTDASVIALCQAIKAKGWNVMLYPMPLVDTTDQTVGETNKPWRGRLEPVLEADVDTFFTRTNGYNNFIRHYTQLTVGGINLKDVVDSFVIGSELRGLTTFTPGADNYPAVTHLATLAGNVQTDLGGTPLVIYAADWSEYHSLDGYYHMDELWTNANIDVVGIDCYFPLTADLPQSSITPEAITAGWEGGEGWDYYWNEARDTQTSYSGDPTFAWKNIEYWWANAHFHNADDPGSPTGWTAKMKPIWFTEIGFPSVDGAANQPNVFVDPSTSESYYPRGSRRRVDYLAQREALETSLDFLDTRNGEAGNSDLVPRRFVWTYDARPFPFFPDITQVWADGPNWKTGHWINGKVGISSLGAIVAELLGKVGFTLADYDVFNLTDGVQGFVIRNRGSVRDIIGTLQLPYFFDMVESGGILKFVKRGGESAATITEEELIPLGDDNIRVPAEITRSEESSLPVRVDVSYINRPTGFLINTQTSQRQTVESVDIMTINLPLVMDDRIAKQVADKTLYNIWIARTFYSFTLPPKYAYIEPTDIITVTLNNVNHVIRVKETQIARGGAIEARGVAEDVSTYDFYTEPGEPSPPVIPGEKNPETRMELMDLNAFPSDTDGQGTLRIAVASEGLEWRGAAVYRSDDGGEADGNTFDVLQQTTSETTMGNVYSEILDLPANIWDDASEIYVTLIAGTLSSVTETAVLNGGNACVCGNEVIQFQTATLIDTNVYKLTRLLRGRLGTESETGNHSLGERFIFLDAGVIRQEVPLQLINIEKYYKPVTVGATVAATAEVAFTYNGNKFKPFSPVCIAATRDGSLNIDITWIRRTRLGGEWRDNVDVPLSEETEAYEIDIMDGVTVVRTLTSTTETVQYTAADQITDFGSEQSSVDVNIYQMSVIIGRGYTGPATI